LVWARGALNIPNRWFPVRVDARAYADHPPCAAH
jgi:hypothetical protein